MNKIKRFAFSCIVFGCTVITSCKTTKITADEPKLNNLPESFTGNKDSLNASYINWKNYFSDSTLISLIDIGLKNHPDLLIALQRIEMARAEVHFIKGLSKPYVAGSAGTSQRKFGKYTMDQAGNYNTKITKDQFIPVHLPDYVVGIQSSWEVDIRGKLRNERKAAVANYLASTEGKNWVVTNLIAEIALAYFELLALDNELLIIQETTSLQENAFSLIKIQKDAGRANELAVEQSEALFLNSSALQMDIRQRIIESENRINFLLGRYPQSIIRDQASFKEIIPTEIQVGIPSDLLKNRPDIREAEQVLISSRANVRAAKAAFYPTFTITGINGFQAFNPKLLFAPESMMYNLFGGLTEPLINRSAIKAEFQSAKASQLEALYNYQKSIINGYIEVYNQMASIRNLEQMYRLKNREVEVLTKSIITSSELFSTGRASYFEVIIAQKNALNSKLQLVDTKRRQYFSVVNIYKALGGGWQ